MRGDPPPVVGRNREVVRTLSDVRREGVLAELIVEWLTRRH
jgi:hypothetical protein